MTSLTANGTEPIGNTKVTVAQLPTATQKGRARVSVQKIQKPKLFTGKPHRITVFADDWDCDFLDVDDVITSYRREDLNKIEHEDGISEKVRWRLFLARQLALLKYKEVHG
jgi:hypothetical protein